MTGAGTLTGDIDNALVTSSSFKKADKGAIAYSKASFADGKSSGIERGKRYEWRRSTAQAAPALTLIG